MPGDGQVIDAWWAEFVRTGRLPASLALVQRRLIRAVFRGELPSGPVYVKTMTFPRAKDRLRYLLRALPGDHEARMLRATAAAGVPCPEVLAVRTARRWGLPFRSLLVLRALPVLDAPDPVAARLRDAAALTARLLAAGIVHHDLHAGNFVRLQSGALAVLDLQSVGARGRRATTRRCRIAVAARLLREHLAGAAGLASALVAGGLLANDAEVAAARAQATRELDRFRRSRVLRCLGNSTEFRRFVTWRGTEYRQRADLPDGHWLPAITNAREVWLGQRALQVFEGRPLAFPALFRKWWWCGGKGALYVPRTCDQDRIELELAAARAGHVRYHAQLASRPPELADSVRPPYPP